MIAELKLISLADHSSFESFVPEHPLDFGVDVRLYIGTVGQDAADSFRLTVCSPEWLRRECALQGFVWRWDLLIVEEFNRVKIVQVLQRMVSRCVGETWDIVVAQLARRMQWEFDTYA